MLNWDAFSTKIITNGRFGLLKNNFIHVLHNPHTTLHMCSVWGLVQLYPHHVPIHCMRGENWNFSAHNQRLVWLEPGSPAPDCISVPAPHLIYCTAMLRISTGKSRLFSYKPATISIFCRDWQNRCWNMEHGTKIICDCVVLISRSPDNEIQQDNF